MTTQPAVTTFVPGVGTILVSPNMWSAFCTYVQALEMLALVQAIAPGATCADGSSTLAPGQMLNSLDGTTKMWEIKGTIPATTLGGPTYAIDELAGGLLDRMTKPNSFIDGNGGPTLAYSVVAPGLAQLYWTGAPVNTGAPAVKPAQGPIEVVA